MKLSSIIFAIGVALGGTPLQGSQSAELSAGIPHQIEAILNDSDQRGPFLQCLYLKTSIITPEMIKAPKDKNPKDKSPKKIDIPLQRRCGLK